jgi:trans-aconitate methyltransferase
MTDTWEERISPESDALLIGEHEARYRFARPAVEAADVWCDLGCGTGITSARAVRDVVPSDVVLVDADEEALAEAGRSYDGVAVERRRVDLTSRADLDALAERLTAGGGRVVVTCFEVIEHLPDFVPVIEWMRALAEDGATVVISVPNDVFTAVKNPFHLTMWGSSTVEELRHLLPEDHVVAGQLALGGSVVAVDADDPAAVEVSATVRVTGVPLQHLLAFGPDAGELRSSSVVVVTDVAAQRVWERQREVDNLYYRWADARVAELEAEVQALRARLGES